MLWDVVRDFFVMYIFGGFTSTHDFYGGTIGSICMVDAGPEYYNGTTGDVFLPLKTFNSDFEMVGDYITIGDWLSTTATIISLVIIVYLCCMLIKQIYNICAHVIG